jgi:hypothetical protein
VNLVPNPGFEMYDTCPNISFNSFIGLDQICKATPWFQPYNPNESPSSSGCGGSSTDFYHQCADELPFFMNDFCFQFPNTGSGFSGIVPLWMNNDNYREYLEVKLINELKINKNYCVSWYSNMGEISRFGCNNIGALFTQDSVFQINPWERIIRNTIIENNEILTDTLNWNLFYKEFKASGGEQFMTVGNFRPDNENLVTSTLNTNSAWAYYLFDDFGVYELPEISAGLGGEIYTLGEHVSLQASCERCWNDLVYRWWPSAGLSDTTILNPIATPEVTTTYYFGLIDTSETVPCIVDLVDSLTVFVTIPQDTVSPPPTSFSWLVYPSPTNGNLTVQFSALEFDSQLLIIDARGRLVRKITVPKNTESLPLDLSQLAAGEYFLQVENEVLKEKRKITKY